MSGFIRNAASSLSASMCILAALATRQGLWIQEEWRNSPSATETLPRLEQADWCRQLILRWSSLFRPEKGVRSGLAWWPLGQGRSSWYSRLSIGLGQEFFIATSPHYHDWRLLPIIYGNQSRRPASLAHCHFQYTSMTLCLPPPCATLIFSQTTRLRMFHPRGSAADSLSDWFDRWHLSIHPSKTVCMALRSRGMPTYPLYIYITGKRIAQVTQHCHLGVTFNDSLSWKDHVHKIALQSAQKIGLLRRLGRHLSPTVLRDIYLFCIRLGVEYSSVAWSGLSSSDALCLERNNRSAAHLILKTSRKEDISHELLLSRAGLSTLEARHNVAQCAVVWKAFFGRHPGHLQRLSPVGYYNQPLAANGNRQKGTTFK